MSLYLELKSDIIKKIIDGTYKIGQPLPTEQELTAQHGLSRVTVRNALEELKKEGLLVGVPRQGTIVTERKGGFHSSMDIIALIAAVHDPFFSQFMEHFEQAAENNGSLMLFKQDFQGKALQSGDFFYRLIQKNIRNIVLWPQTDQIDLQLLDRLHAVGINFVIYDQMFATDVADSVGVDNRHAIGTLYAELRRSLPAHQAVAYVDFAGLELPSAVQRRAAFAHVSLPADRTYSVPWLIDPDEAAGRLLEQLQAADRLPGAFLCNSGGIGLAVARRIQAMGLAADIAVATVDLMPDMLALPMLAYKQPTPLMAEKAYQRLVAQNNQGSSWQAAWYPVQGELVVCGAGETG